MYIGLRIYENCVTTLNQNTHMHYDFTTPEALKTLQAKEKREKRAGKGDWKNEKE